MLRYIKWNLSSFQIFRFVDSPADGILHELFQRILGLIQTVSSLSQSELPNPPYSTAVLLVSGIYTYKCREHVKAFKITRLTFFSLSSVGGRRSVVVSKLRCKSPGRAIDPALWHVSSLIIIRPGYLQPFKAISVQSQWPKTRSFHFVTFGEV